MWTAVELSNPALGLRLADCFVGGPGVTRARHPLPLMRSFPPSTCSGLFAFRTFLLLVGSIWGPLAHAADTRPVLRAGAAAVDISPTNFPVIVNAMFTERTATRTVDPLHARALVLDDGSVRLALVVVDTCMMPRDLIDRAKALAHVATKLPPERVMISATHTHSAPSAMGCLGSRVDPRYAAFLPGRIAAAIEEAVRNLGPAEIGWARTDDWDHTFHRRWIRRSDRLLTDPFGQANVRAHMHPGHLSPDAIGPSGPVDPGLSVLAVRTPEGHPLAVFANYSQHYYGSDLVSSDYYGKFATEIGRLLGAGGTNRPAGLPPFVGIMSQGTSGDQMWMDYGAPRKEIGYEAYAREVAQRAHGVFPLMRFRRDVRLGIEEQKLRLRYPVPDTNRLAWARDMAAKLGDRLPSTLPEIYALEALHLHERQETELVLQAIRIGEVGITAIPNEVFALTGLKLKARSPLPFTFNVELANGAEGYIPPPEQHVLGGYTTWPARTAGLEVQAEPRIVESLLHLLEEVSGTERRGMAEANGPYVSAVLGSRPHAYWRLEETEGVQARSASGIPRLPSAMYEPGIARFLPGPGSGEGVSPQPALLPSAFSGANQINRAPHFAGGRLQSPHFVRTNAPYSVEFWFWNGLTNNVRPVTGYLFSRGDDGDTNAVGDHVGIGGAGDSAAPGRLFFFNGNVKRQVLAGRTPIPERTWHHVVVVRDGDRVRVHLDGHEQPEIEGSAEVTLSRDRGTLFFGGRCDRFAGLEGRMDEVAVYARALARAEIAAHHRASGLPALPLAPVPAGAATAPKTRARQTATPPLSPAASLAKIHVPEGYRVELAAAEPLTIDPVAIDWDVSGRCWVVEMADYPLGMDGEGKPGGRIRVLEDSDGDGRYDQSTVFADDLNFPNGLLTWRDGVLVTAAPDLLYLRDTDGDGRADTREVLWTGFMQDNQQLRMNGLRWGLDNWVYCASGGHHRGHGTGTVVRSPKSGKTVQLGSRDFRFLPDGDELDPQSGPTQFGRNRDDWGHWFGTQNSWPLWHYVLPDPYLRRNAFVAAPDPVRQVLGPMNPPVYPASPQEKRYHSFNEAGHFTSACGGMIYRDNLLFPGAVPLHSFTCEPFHNLVHHGTLLDDGVSFSGRRAAGEERGEFFASEDRWCRPVMTRTGPDGALWVVDMYRYMIELPQWLPPEGRAELLPHYREGDDKGRLYRVVPAVAPRRTAPVLGRLKPVELVAALDSPNGWQRDKAHQLLLWRGRTDASSNQVATVNALARLARTASRPQARLHALCVLDGLDRLPSDLLVAALSDPHPGIRENALRLAERRTEPAIVDAALRRVGDTDAKVRLQLALSLGQWTGGKAGEALGKLALADGKDPFMAAAIMSSAVPHGRDLAEMVVRGGERPWNTLGVPLIELFLGQRDRDALARILEPTLVPVADPSPTNSGYAGWQVAAFLRGLESIERRQSSVAALANVPGDRLTALLATKVPRIFDAAAARVADARLTPGERLVAASLLATDSRRREAGLRALLDWLRPQFPTELQREVIQRLQATADSTVSTLLLGRWPELGPASRDSVLDALLSRTPWVRDLVSAIRDGTVHPSAFDASRRSRLARHVDVDVRAAAARFFSTNAAPTTARSAVVTAFRPALKLSGDARRGAEIFSKACQVCHRHGDQGNEIGPDLRSVVEHPPEKLLVNILDPSADVQPGFQAYQCTLANGEELYGIIAAETGNSVVLKLVDGSTRTLLRQDIRELRGSGLSLMPEGLEAGWKPADLADLIAFLKTKGD